MSVHSNKGIFNCRCSVRSTDWDGFFLNIDIIHPDGTDQFNGHLAQWELMTTSMTCELAIVYGDCDEVTFVSNNPDNDQFQLCDFDEEGCIRCGSHFVQRR